jgi:hypothetical protein
MGMEGNRPLLSLRSRVSLALFLTLVGLVIVGAQQPAGAASADETASPAVTSPLAATNGVTGAADLAPWIVGGSLAVMLVGAALVFLTLRPEPVLVEMRSLRPIEPVSPNEQRAARRRRRR